jgi:uncharacterized protein YpuA (DUF1002 family)
MVNYATKATTYTKTEVDDKCNNIIAGAPNALNTLKELSDALGSDANYSTTVLNHIGTKANSTDVYSKAEVNSFLDDKADFFTVESPLSFLFNPQQPELVKLQADVYNKTTVDTKLADKTDKSTTNNSATAWSSGLASDAYHYIDTGSDALVIRTPSGNISANFLGNVGGPAYDGKAMFYKDVAILGDLRLGTGQTTLTSLLDLKAPLNNPTFKNGLTITDANNVAKILLGTTATCNFYTDLDVSGNIATPGTVYSGGDPCLTSYNAYTKSEVDQSFTTLKANPTFNGTVTAPTLNVFAIKTASGATTSGVTIDGVDFRNSSNQSIMTVHGNSLAVSFEGNILCEGKVSALNFDNLDVDGWIKTNHYLMTNTIQGYSADTVTVNDKLAVLDDMSVSGSRLNVVTQITNTQVNGFSSLYFYNTSGSTPAAETAQIYNGQNTGLNIATNTAHSIKFAANRFAAGAVNSIEIQGTGTRNVVINSPLVCNGPATLNQTLQVGGDLSVTGFYQVKPWVGFHFASGAISYHIGHNTSGITFSRPNGANGLYQFNIPSHPKGTQFLVVVQARTGSTGSVAYACTANVGSATAFYIWCRKFDNTIVDGEFYAYTVP